MRRGAVSIRLAGLLLAAIAGVAALGWIVGQWLPVDWERSPVERQRSEQVEELPLADQVAAVASGASGTIHVARSPVARSDLVQLSGLEELQVLLLDHEDNAIADRDCQVLSGLDHLIHLRIRGGSIGDDGIAHLAALRNLKIINLPHSRVTNRGLASLESAPELALLRLGSGQITDEGLAHLAAFPSLKQLHLIDAPITDAGLETIAALPRLESFYLDGSRVTDEGLERLFRLRPDLHVHINQQHHDRDVKRGHQ